MLNSPYEEFDDIIRQLQTMAYSSSMRDIRNAHKVLMSVILDIIETGDVNYINEFMKTVNVKTLNDRTLTVLTRSTSSARYNLPEWLNFTKRSYNECLNRGLDADGLYIGINFYEEGL